jgi:catechol 2,3-dioxygenase-like lactoylglutathione lyase family enzyme
LLASHRHGHRQVRTVRRLADALVLGACDRGPDIGQAYAEWSAKGAEFLTEPKDHGREIRAYIRDPDGHLIEVGQTTPRPGSS